MPHFHVACAIIARNGLILAAQRSAAMKLPHKWEFPGGKLEPGERPAECLLREIREELGVEIVIIAPLPPTDWAYSDFSVTLHPFVAEIMAGREPALTEHQAIRWLPPEELSSLDWAAADAPVLQHLSDYLLRKK